MAEKSLLDRLRDPAGERSAAADGLQDLADSVLRHLHRLLNSRQGSAAAAPDYGVPDLTEVARAYPESAGTLEDAIRSTIERFEPRLADVSVRHVEGEGDALTLSFEVTARVSTGREEAGIAFTTRVDPEGRVEIRG